MAQPAPPSPASARRARQAIGALPEVRPTFTATVPRIWEKLKAGGSRAGLDAESDERKRATVRAAPRRGGCARLRLELTGRARLPQGGFAEVCRRAPTPPCVLGRGAEEAGPRRRPGRDVRRRADLGPRCWSSSPPSGIPICEVLGPSRRPRPSSPRRPRGRDPHRHRRERPQPGIELRLADPPSHQARARHPWASLWDRGEANCDGGSGPRSDPDLAYTSISKHDPDARDEGLRLAPGRGEGEDRHVYFPVIEPEKAGASALGPSVGQDLWRLADQAPRPT